MPWDSNLTASVNFASASWSGLNAELIASILLAMVCLLVISLAVHPLFTRWVSLGGKLRGVIRSFAIGVPVALAFVLSYRALVRLIDGVQDVGLTWVDIGRAILAVIAVTVLGYVADKVGSRIAVNLRELQGSENES